MTLSILILPASATFSDVPSNAWYYSDINDVQKYGIIQGIGNNRFDPNGTLTLAQAITMASRAHAYLNGNTISASSSGTWYQPYVDYASRNGICDVRGASLTAACNRLVMAQLFYKVFPQSTAKQLNQVNSLPDVENTAANVSVFFLYRQGVLAGSDKYGTFRPQASITRAETAAILNRVLDSSKRKKFTLQESETSDKLGAHYAAALKQAYNHFSEDLAWAEKMGLGYGKMTYALYDADNDGVKELYVGFSEIPDGAFAVYVDTGTYAKNIALGVVSGDPRYDESWGVAKGGILYHAWHGGFMGWGVDYYRLNGSTLKFIESWMVDGSTSPYYFYSATTPGATANNLNGFKGVSESSYINGIHKHQDVTLPFQVWKQ